MPGMFSGGFLTQKTGSLPNWSYGVGAVAALVLFKTWQKNKATTVPDSGPSIDGSTTPGTASNYVRPGTGSGAYNTGAPTVFVVPGATPSAPSQPPLIGRDPTPNPASDVRTTLNSDVFNQAGWSATAKQAPWKMMVANPGETWLDITARMYGYADNFSKVTDPASKTRIQSVAEFVKKTNGGFTGTVPDGTGPKPGAVVVYR